MNRFASVLTFALLFGCASTSQGQDYAAVAKLAMSYIDKNFGERKVVLPTTIDIDAKNALIEAGTQVVASEEVPYSDQNSLPAGYMLLRKFKVSGDHADFEFTLGPVRRLRPEEMLLSCGKGVDLSFQHVSSEWQLQPVRTFVC